MSQYPLVTFGFIKANNLSIKFQEDPPGWDLNKQWPRAADGNFPANTSRGQAGIPASRSEVLILGVEGGREGCSVQLYPTIQGECSCTNYPIVQIIVDLLFFTQNVVVFFKVYIFHYKMLYFYFCFVRSFYRYLGFKSPRNRIKDSFKFVCFHLQLLTRKLVNIIGF